jgi:hypothetical protein
MSLYLCALCGATVPEGSVAHHGGTPFCFSTTARSCYAEASVRREVTRLNESKSSDGLTPSGLSDSAVAHLPRREDGAPGEAPGAPSKNERRQ